MELQEVQQQVIDNIISELGEEWPKIKNKYKAKILAAARLWAKLEYKNYMGQIELDNDDRLQIESITKSWRYAGSAIARKAFWESAYKVSSTLGQLATEFAKGALASLI